MSVGQYVIGGLLGLAFGFAVACCSALLTKKSLKKGKTAAVMGVSFLRQLMDIAALFIVFLLRNVVPLPLYAMLIGTALGLSAGGILLASRIGRDVKQDDGQNDDY